MEQREAEQWISIWDIFNEVAESLFWMISMSQEFFFMDTEEKTSTFFLPDMDVKETSETEKRREENFFEKSYEYVSVLKLLNKQNDIQNFIQNNTQNDVQNNAQNEMYKENITFPRELQKECLERYATFFMEKNENREEIDILGRQEDTYSQNNYFLKEDMLFGEKEYYISILEQFQQGMESDMDWKQDEQLEEGSIFPTMASKGSSYVDIEEIMAEITQRLLEERSRSKKKVERWR
jgi:hypothetical protein